MDNTCGVFAVVGNRVLVCHITGRPASGPSTYSVPKGLADGEEDYRDAAARELFEETSLAVHPANLVELPSVKYSTRKDKVLHPFWWEAPEDTQTMELRCDSMVPAHVYGKELPEVDSFEWMEMDLACEVLHETQVKVLLEHWPDVIEKLKKKRHED